MEIIDFHTHTFEDYVAKRAVEKLMSSANIMSYADGTDQDLQRKNIEENIFLSVVLPVATRIMQGNDINSRSYKKNLRSCETGLMYFAAIHPEDSDIRKKLSEIKAAGFKGIKLHPVFQSLCIDDTEYLELIDIASDLDLITVIHAGEDISFPGNDWASVKYILNMINIVKPRNLVLAHMGGYKEWDIVESDLAGADVFLDTSSCLEKMVPYDNSKYCYSESLSKEQFLRIVRLHGVNKVLFGSDSPWSSRAAAVNNLKESGLGEEELRKILSENAKRLLGI